MITFGDATTGLAKYVDGGKATTDPVVKERINEACEILSVEGDWKHLVRRIRVNKTGNIFSLPMSVDTIIKVNRCRQPAFVWGQGFEFMMGGYGSVIDGSAIATTDLIHMGDGFPTFFPITSEVGTVAKKLVAFSKNPSDAGKSIRVRGYDSSRNEISPTTPGEVITIQQWYKGEEGQIDGGSVNFSDNEFIEISSIEKDETTDYVTLYAVTSADNKYWFLGKYHPYETNPGYSWYKISNSECDDEEHLVLLVKIKHVDMVHSSDILTIQSLHAVKLMLKALYQFDWGDSSKGLMLQNTALLFLNKQLANSNRGQKQIDQDTLGTMGEVEPML